MRYFSLVATARGLASCDMDQGVHSVERAVSILRALGEPEAVDPSLVHENEHEGLPLSAIAKLVELSPSTTHRIIRTLVGTHFVEQDPLTERYRLGPLAGVLGRSYLASVGLERAQPILRKLCVATGESVSLAVFQNGAAHVVLQEHSSHALRVDHLAGKELSLHASAMGKVLVAFSETQLSDAIANLGELEKFTPNTVSEASELIAHLELVKKQGFATNEGERYEGANGIAVPVLTSRATQTTTRYALGVQGPATRLTAERMAELVQPCRDAAAEIAALGIHVS